MLNLQELISYKLDEATMNLLQVTDRCNNTSYPCKIHHLGGNPNRILLTFWSLGFSSGSSWRRSFFLVWFLAGSAAEFLPLGFLLRKLPALAGFLVVTTHRSAHRAIFSVYIACFGIKIWKLVCAGSWLGWHDLNFLDCSPRQWLLYFIFYYQSQAN